jgi:arginine-tRNA-protein transferase
LPGREERKVFAHLPMLDGAAMNDALTLGGFRRSQNIAYRPACESCAACVSVRLPVAAYTFSRSERRVMARNATFSRHEVEAEATREQFVLLQSYLAHRHAGGGMAGMSWFDFVAMIEDTSVRTHLVEYRSRSTDNGPGALIACTLVDRLADGLSLVYSFYEPTLTRNSLGSFIILDNVLAARRRGDDFLYLGYWVPGSQKMAYKARFSPAQVLKPEGWVLLTQAERAQARSNAE